jgi:ribonuclease HII
MSSSVGGRTWKNLTREDAAEIKERLLMQGGVEEEVKSPSEEWRVKLSDSTFTFYKNGTLYSTPSRSQDRNVLDMWSYIDSRSPRFIIPSRDLLIGLDETGKGEIIGHVVLAGVIFPKDLFDELSDIVSTADTKRRHDFKYWDEIFRRIDGLMKHGFRYEVQTISPEEVDEYNLNKIMDVTYQRILSKFTRDADMRSCRVVLDDYGVGSTLGRYLNFLRNQGAEVIVENKADERYLEVKVASLVSKRIREEIIERINENPDFQIDGLSVGSGNPNDMQTIKWLGKWYESGRDWPWFIRRSYETVRRIEGKPERSKQIPPIKEELLSEEFLEEFNKGRLSIQSLAIICPHCGSINKSVTFAIYEDDGRKISGIKCPKCKKLIENAGITLRYYCGYVVPDTNVVIRGVISKDLESSRFFEGFTIILPNVVRKEADNRKGKQELGKLAELSSMGRIRLESPGKVEEIPENMPSVARDEKIVDIALQYNAILITSDQGIRAYASSKGVFHIYI